MALGFEVNLRPGDFVLDGDPAPPQKGTERPSPFLGPFLLWPNGWVHQDASWYGGKRRSRRRCVRWGRSSPLKGAQPPSPVFGSCLLWPNGWMDEHATWYGSRPRLRLHCVRRGPCCPAKWVQQSPHVFGPSLLWPRSPITATLC